MTGDLYAYLTSSRHSWRQRFCVPAFLSEDNDICPNLLCNYPHCHSKELPCCPLLTRSYFCQKSWVRSVQYGEALDWFWKQAQLIQIRIKILKKIGYVSNFIFFNHLWSTLTLQIFTDLNCTYWRESLIKPVVKIS